jgi:CheY-like chemotaxis protein
MRQRVLLVEDSAVQATHLQQHLQQHGLNVEVVGSGRQALEQIRFVPPDVIVLDIELPDMSGYEICRALKNNPETAHIPITMRLMV